MTDKKDQSTDLLIWLAAGVVVFMGLAWVVIEAPWSSEEEYAALEPAAAPAAAVSAGSSTDDAIGAEGPADAARLAEPSMPAANDPLHLARLALEAGMLIEPQDYSAWTLFGAVATSDPDNEEARTGLEQVADILMRRGESALEQGRYRDAEVIAETIRERLPQHIAAIDLSERVALAMRPPPEPVVEIEPEPESPPVAETPVDPVPELHAAFIRAMAANSVLTPPGESARDLVGRMLDIDPENELAVAARDMLVTEMLDRSRQSIEALDTAAAQTWIDSAAPLAADTSRIAEAQDRLTRHLIEIESQKRLPASALKRLVYVPPEYPEIAITRGIEGWVDVEFVVGADGEPEEVTVTDGSHDRYFRDEAIAAVEEWRFEPVIFMDQPIPQRSYTRLAFVFE